MAAAERAAAREPAPPLRQRVLSRALADGLVVGVILGWWAMSKALPASILPTPAEVAEQVWLLLTDPVYLGHTAASGASSPASERPRAGYPRPQRASA